MAKLRCVRHNRRVQIIDIGTDGFDIPLTVHRSNSKNNEICDSKMVSIDGEFFTPQMVIDDDWSMVDEVSENPEMVDA